MLCFHGAGDFFEEFFVAPIATGNGSFGITQSGLIAFLFGRVVLCERIHFVGINFVVPPGETKVGGDHVGARMDMADHALAGGNGAGERVLDGMARLIFGNGGIGGGAMGEIAERGVRG